MLKYIVLGVSLCALPILAMGQSEPSGNTLAATIDVFVFPAKGQDASLQSQEEVECYDWASTNVGSDPFRLSQQQASDERRAEAEMAAAEQAGQGPDGSIVRGAVAGAVIGDLTGGGAQEGSAIGAGVGLLAQRRRAQAQEQAAVQQAESNNESRVQATESEIEDFKKAFSICLEAKEYMVRF